MSMMKPHRKLRSAFTIVELLIVVVVIAVLAAITIVAYNSITAQAKESALKSELRAISSQLRQMKEVDGLYPESINDLAKNNSFEYRYIHSQDTFCVDARAPGVETSFYSSGEGSILEGRCQLRWISMASGYDHTCGVSSSYEVYCWGRNHNGQLGIGTTEDSTVPRLVSQGELPTTIKIEQIVAGNHHNCILTSSKEVYCWGDNYYGTVGVNRSGSDVLVPTRLANVGIPSGITVDRLTAGGAHTCALGSNGRAYCWGDNGYGQLGKGSTGSTSYPVVVAIGAVPAGVQLQDISAGYYHTCALGSNNHVYCWGRANYNQLGAGTTDRLSPVAVGGGGNIYDGWVSTGSYHTCAGTLDGRASCWGRNEYRQAGTGTISSPVGPVPIVESVVPAGSPINYISGGGNFTCALSNALVYCWGDNLSGYRLNYPAINDGIDGTVVAISSGWSHSCALSATGSLYCWGVGSYGKLGDGGVASRSVPTLVQSP